MKEDVTATGFINKVMTVNGAERRYVVYVPHDYTPDKAEKRIQNDGYGIKKINRCDFARAAAQRPLCIGSNRHFQLYINLILDPYSTLEYLLRI